MFSSVQRRGLVSRLRGPGKVCYNRGRCLIGILTNSHLF